jgi:phosphocarrier protein
MSVKRTIAVVNKKGLHARASRKLAELALTYESTRIIVRREEDEADARSLMDLMMLGAGIGSNVDVETRGPKVRGDDGSGGAFRRPLPRG